MSSACHETGIVYELVLLDVRCRQTIAQLRYLARYLGTRKAT